MRITLTGLTLSSTMRMIDRVHDNTTNVGTLPLPSSPASLTDAHVFVIDIADLTDRRHAGRQDLPHFSGLQTNLNIVAIAPHDLRRSTRASDQLTTLPTFNSILA
jgi:hypothetical protein